jgi:hypothetical protein
MVEVDGDRHLGLACGALGRGHGQLEVVALEIQTS